MKCDVERQTRCPELSREVDTSVNFKSSRLAREHFSSNNPTTSSSSVLSRRHRQRYYSAQTGTVARYCKYCNQPQWSGAPSVELLVVLR